MMNFRLAELRKRHNLTQQELGDILSVSYQTISKWENGVAYPDISMLPQISGYFGVSVDVLLGLEPLDESYTPSNSGKVEYWEKRLEYLKRTRKTMWNEDYVRFLVRDVWKIDRPVTLLDCGCGFGSLGMLLLPVFPSGSKYVGVDFSPTMIKAAEACFQELSIEAQFIVSDIMEYQPKQQYDMVISQAVLRHVDNGEMFLRRMVSFVKKGGLFYCHENTSLYESSRAKGYLLQNE